MASTGLELPAGNLQHTHSKEKDEKFPADGTAMARGGDDEAMPYSPGDGNSLKPIYDSTHRKLKPRHIQLIGIGG